MKDIVYFELNDWVCGEFYPDEDPFLSWMQGEVRFLDENWVKANKLVVVTCLVDMSIAVCVSAPKSWVMIHCPRLLTEHTQFLRYKNKKNTVEGEFADFLEYTPENIGVHFVE